MDIKQPILETVAISKLKPWAKNPRIKHQVDGIAKSIEAFGYLSPIIVQAKTYRVLSGHGRLKALKRKGVKQVPVIVAAITDRNADLFTIADNKLNDSSMFDLKATADLLKGLGKLDFRLTGFGEDELQKLLGAQGEINDAETVAKNLRKVTFYAGEDGSANKTAMNDRTLVVVFESEQELAFVKNRIHQLQTGKSKSIGDVIYKLFKSQFKNKAHR